MHCKLTIFTPTYNRAELLTRTYKSLCGQSCKAFKWVIIDDGSADNTAELVCEWIRAASLSIEYYYKPNGGMHTAHNLAYEKLTTELNVCIDSDDIMPPDAVENILAFWQAHGDSSCAGIVALDADFEGKVLGDMLPKDGTKATMMELEHKYKIKGDKKLIYRTELIKSLPPYPEFEGERLVPLSYKYRLADLQAPLLAMNKIVCNVEYQAEGSSNTIVRQYFQSPRGFAEYRKMCMCNSLSFKRRFIDCAQYVVSSIILKNKKFLQESPKKLLTLMAIPAGVVLYFWFKHKAFLN
ncbi:MAG: glycosyltransferase family 2 protein [Oscillospiraceae bacterium]|jgi:glycosyltransferase involved in cell wall biosynthesis|nr:glycosyltransferase family 2 protein [Oscillospiraceae bacterium]